MGKKRTTINNIRLLWTLHDAGLKNLSLEEIFRRYNDMDHGRSRASKGTLAAVLHAEINAGFVSIEPDGASLTATGKRYTMMLFDPAYPARGQVRDRFLVRPFGQSNYKGSKHYDPTRFRKGMVLRGLEFLHAQDGYPWMTAKQLSDLLHMAPSAVNSALAPAKGERSGGLLETNSVEHFAKPRKFRLGNPSNFLPELLEGEYDDRLIAPHFEEIEQVVLQALLDLVEAQSRLSKKFLHASQIRNAAAFDPYPGINEAGISNVLIMLAEKKPHLVDYERDPIGPPCRFRLVDDFDELVAALLGKPKNIDGAMQDLLDEPDDTAPEPWSGLLTDEDAESQMEVEVNQLGGDPIVTDEIQRAMTLSPLQQWDPKDDEPLPLSADDDNIDELDLSDPVEPEPVPEQVEEPEALQTAQAAPTGGWPAGGANDLKGKETAKKARSLAAYQAKANGSWAKNRALPKALYDELAHVAVLMGVPTMELAEGIIKDRLRVIRESIGRRLPTSLKKKGVPTKVDTPRSNEA